MKGITAGIPIPNTQFVPFLIPKKASFNYDSISKLVNNPPTKNYLIFVLRPKEDVIRQIDIPNFCVECVIVPNFSIGNSGEYIKFKEVIFQILIQIKKGCPYNYRKFQLAIVGHSPDLLGYFLVKWLIEECNYSLENAIQCYQKSIGFSITKEKYFHSLEQNYGNINDTNNFEDLKGESQPFYEFSPIETSTVPQSVSPQPNFNINQNNHIISSHEIKSIVNMYLPNFKQRKYIKITRTIIDKLRKENTEYCVMPLPNGEPCFFFFVESHKTFLITDFQYQKHKQFNSISHNISGNSLFEGIMIGDAIYLTDLYLHNNKDIRNLKFSERIQSAYEFITQVDFQGQQIELIHFYNIFDFEKLINKKFQYELKGWVYTKPNGSSFLFYKWEYKKEFPVALLHIDVTKNKAFGQLINESRTLVDAIDLGGFTPQMFRLNGMLVDVDVKIPNKSGISTGRIIGKSESKLPWDIDKFQNNILDNIPPVELSNLIKISKPNFRDSLYGF